MKLPISSEIVILRIELGIVMTMVISAAGGGGETNSFRNNDNVEYKKGMAFNMLKPSDKGENITPSKDNTVDEELQSTL